MKTFLKILLILSGTAFIGVSIVSLLAWDRWWITALSYPWEQLTLLSCVVLGLSFWVLRWRQRWAKLYLTVLIITALYQGQVLLPFTFLYPKAVATVEPTATTFHLMVSNVKMTNQETARHLALVQQVDPDMVLVLELSHRWQEALAPLRTAYPYHVEQPHEDAYGMGIYARLPADEYNRLPFCRSDNAHHLHGTDFAHRNAGGLLWGASTPTAAL